MKTINSLNNWIKVVCILLPLLILLPTIVKLNHVFETHKHEVCKGKSNSHLHALDLDCEFYKFKLNKTYYSHLTYFELANNKILTQKIEYVNTVNSNNTHLTYFLRGPPIQSL